jgi:hypothetical protein
MGNNEEYNPEKPLYYNYAIKNFLIKDYNLFHDTNEYSKIILCVYTINRSGKYPFVQYLLSNDGFDNLRLPVLPIFSALNKDVLISYPKVFLSGILQIEAFEEFNKCVEFDGYYEFEKKLYLFFDVTEYNLNIDNIYSSSPITFVLIDEIINHRSMCNIPITKETIDFFIKNSSIDYLYDENNDAYEIPIVGFTGKSTPQKLNFIYTFGESAKNKSEILGSYYYFTNFKNAIRQGGWSNNYKPEYSYNQLTTDNEFGRYIKGGIVRFALFTGNTKYIENMPNDPIDESDIKKQRMNDKSLDQNYEIQTLRISDYDGIWAKTYNSAYLGNIELDDGSYLKEIPMIVLKEYKQQIPLSYHYIDKKKLDNKYEPDNHSYGIV